MQNATRPDVDKLISGGRMRRRRRNVRRAAGGAIGVALIGAGGYAVMQLDRSDTGSTGTATSPSGTSASSGAVRPRTLPADGGDLEPGTYRVLVGADSTGSAIGADLTFEGPGWDSGNFPVVATGGSYGGLGVYEPSTLAAGTGCSGDAPDAVVAETPRALAEQLAQLPRSTVVQPVAPTEAYGHDAFDLRLRIAADCPEGRAYRVAETPRGSRGVSYGSVPKTVVIDFWVLDLDGETVVVDAWHQSDASQDLVDQVALARESITFVAGD